MHLIVLAVSVWQAVLQQQCYFTLEYLYSHTKHNLTHFFAYAVGLVMLKTAFEASAPWPKVSHDMPFNCHVHVIEPAAVGLLGGVLLHTVGAHLHVCSCLQIVKLIA